MCRIVAEVSDNYAIDVLLVFTHFCSWFHHVHRSGSFALENCEVLTSSVLKVINKCYWNSTESDGCMSAEENELSEACIKTLTVSANRFPPLHAAYSLKFFSDLFPFHWTHVRALPQTPHVQTLLIQPDAHRYPNSALQLLNMVVESLSPITKAEWKENNSNEDIAFNIYTLLISAIECHSRLLIAGVLTESAEHRNLYMRLIHEILQCTDKPGIYPVEESCSILAMGFWYMLQDEVLSNDNVTQKMKALELIGPLYSHLTLILVRKAQQPDESSIGKWNADDLETFRCYRQDISDTLVSFMRFFSIFLLEKHPTNDRINFSYIVTRCFTTTCWIFWRVL